MTTAGRMTVRDWLIVGLGLTFIGVGIIDSYVFEVYGAGLLCGWSLSTEALRPRDDKKGSN